MRWPGTVGQAHDASTSPFAWTPLPTGASLRPSLRAPAAHRTYIRAHSQYLSRIEQHSIVSPINFSLLQLIMFGHHHGFWHHQQQAWHNPHGNPAQIVHHIRRRGPSRLLWFVLGAGATTLWLKSHQRHVVQSERQGRDTSGQWIGSDPSIAAVRWDTSLGGPVY